MYRNFLCSLSEGHNICSEYVGKSLVSAVKLRADYFKDLEYWSAWMINLNLQFLKVQSNTSDMKFGVVKYLTKLSTHLMSVVGCIKQVVQYWIRTILEIACWLNKRILKLKFSTDKSAFIYAALNLLSRTNSLTKFQSVAC